MTLFRHSATAVERVRSMACCSHRVARRINPNSSNRWMNFSGSSPCSDKSALGKTMASDDKKTKTSPAPKNEAAVKKEAAAKKKTRASRRTRARQVQTYPRLRAARKLPTYPQVIVGAKAKNRFRKLIRITGTRFTRRKRNDNSDVAAAFRPRTRSWTFGKVRRCAFACGHQAKIDRRY